MDKHALERLAEIFAVVLDLPPDVDAGTVRRLQHPTWDSLATVSLMAAAEGEFGIRLDTTDAERITSFEAMVALLEERGV